MKPSARLADATRELGLDGHVDVLVVDIERERAGIDVGLDLRQPGTDGLGVLLADHALRGKHRRMRPRSRDILSIEMLVDRERRAELLRRRCHAVLEPTAPKRHMNLRVKSSERDGAP